MFYVFIVSISFNVIVLIFLVTLLFRQRRLTKNLSVIGKKAAEGNLSYVINQSYDQLTKLSSNFDELNKQKNKLSAQLNNAFQKIGLVRYCAFNESSGNQSFSLAILNNNKDGLIVTGINTRNENRLYVKHVIGGSSSEHQLTPEEAQAIKQAKKNSVKIIPSKPKTLVSSKNIS